MAHHELQRAVKDACKTVEAASAALKAKRSATTDINGRDHLKSTLIATAEAIKTEVAKCTVMVNELRADPLLAEPILHTIQQKAIALCAITSALQEGGGPTLISQLFKAASSVTAACVRFMQQLIYEDPSAEAVRKLAGVVFQQCSAINRAPQDNRTAIGRRICKSAAQIKDTAREVKELSMEVRQSNPALEAQLATAGDQQASQERNNFPDLRAAPASANPVNQQLQRLDIHKDETSAVDSSEVLKASEDDRVDDGVDAYVYDFCTGTASSVEIAAVDTTLQFIHRVSDLLLAIIRGLHGCCPDLGAAAEAWESVLFHVDELASSVNDLGAGLYPPQDTEELQSALAAVCLGCENIAEDLQDSQAISEAFSKVRDACEAAHVAIHNK